ncbi:response regulator transcription factor [Jiangella mangrovi]|uniref:DNA-binding response OmpR family regulator n=1 Tax=Jiangella mangrovi TaxID=1524084 RepID=A0A7W9GRX8_9ACTN|nr:response regulator transcription factor [Jiangella mangrovi]MBB5788942.1 DNA-binding response OmpR family regulator [Jiangella mangrovi]
MTRILVIDDEPDLVRFVRRALEADGYQVLTATEGAEGLRLALTQVPDLIVLDLLMPGVDGHTVLTGVLSRHPHMRVLVLSAAADVEARVSCLERGAVDFLAKPFSIRELLVRVRSRLRGAGEAGGVEPTLRVGSISLDVRARRLTVDGRESTLSQREFLLLMHLMRHADAVCSRAELLSAVWGYDFDVATNVVDVYVGRLRAKLRRDLIQTVRNVGYQLQTA